MRDMWDPRAYDRFRSERRQPFRDLLALVEPRPRMRVVDLGCGVGATTRLLHDHLRAAYTLGIDRSPAMLAQAERMADHDLGFVAGDVSMFRDVGVWDLVFSNAVLHWVDDHRTTLEHLVAALTPGGQLALQFPSNFHHPAHTAAAAVAREQPFATHLGGWERRNPVETPERYATWLTGLGCERQAVRMQIYVHQLPSTDAVVDWTRATLLTDYLARLEPDDGARFVERYRARLTEVLGDQRPYLYTYRRLLLWARWP